MRIATILLVLSLAVPVTASAQEGQTQQPPAKVELASSFLIPQAEHKAISHTPCVLFTRDGKHMWTATADGEAIVFDTSTGQLLRRFSLPEKPTGAVSIDADGRLLAMALTKGGVAIVNLESGKPLNRGGGPADCVSVSPDARWVAVSHAKELLVYELPSLQLAQSIAGHEAEITNLAWSSDGRLVGSAAKDGRLLVYNLAAKRAAYETKKNEPLYALAFHPRDPIVSYGGQDRQVYEYDMASGREQVVSQGQPYWITCLGYSPDGSMLTVGDESCDIWLYDRPTRRMVFHNKHHLECWLNSVAWAPDNETFLFGCRPNSHAGKPAVYAALTVAEASQAAAVSQKREQLDRAIEDELAKVSEAKQRQALLAYRDRLRQPPSVGGKGFAMGGLAGGVDGLQFQASFAEAEGVSGTGLTAADVDAAGYGPAGIGGKPVEELPPAIQKLAQDYQQTLKDEVKRLQSNYCLNQWKVKRQEQTQKK